MWLPLLAPSAGRVLCWEEALSAGSVLAGGVMCFQPCDLGEKKTRLSWVTGEVPAQTASVRTSSSKPAH